MNTIQKIMNRHFQVSIIRVIFYACVLMTISVSVVTFAQWRFDVVDLAQKKIARWLFYFVPADQTPSLVQELVSPIPVAPDIHDVALNILAVQSRLPGTNDLVIAKGEDQNYLRSILKIIFPDGTAGLSEEQISIEILRYVTSALDLKDNSGSATKILREGYAICGGRSVSFETLVRLVGIPARWVNIYGLVSQGGHTVVEVYYDGQWHLYDPTYGTFFYSKPEYDKSGVVSSLNELVTELPEEWYVFKVVDQPWGEYDEITRSFGIVQAEDDYLADFYGYPFFDQYQQMFATTFPVAYDSSQIISFPVIADLTQEGSFSVGSVDNSDSDTIAATTAAETAGKTGMYYLVGETRRQYVHTWFIKTPSPGLVRITYYSTENMPPVLMLFPLKGVYVVSASQDDKKAEFLLRVSDTDASVQFWSSDDIFWVDAVQAEWLGASTDVK